MTKDRIVELNVSISIQNVTAQVKFNVMQGAVATCPKVNMGCGRKRIPSLLDSGSQVTLICQSYFKWKILPHIIPSSEEKAETHQLFQLTAATNGKLPMSMYFKLDLDFWGVMVPKFGVLITQEPNEVLDELHKTKLPDVIGWNLIKLAYQVFIQRFGAKSLEHFDCPTGISPLLFSQLCVFHHNKAGGIQSDSEIINTIGQQQQSKRKPNNFPSVKMGY